MTCNFFSIIDPSYQGNTAAAPSIGWCRTHNRRADICSVVGEAIAIEREECFKIAETAGREWDGMNGRRTAFDIAAAIRARGQT